jgi:protein AbiQ
MNWFTVEEEYLTYIRSHEGRIPKTDYGDGKFKPFFGALFEVGDLVYITQVSHPQRRHYNLKEDMDFVKLYDGTRLIAVVNLNYMFPVHKSRLINVEYKNIEYFRTFENDKEKSDYITLLKREMKEIKKRGLDQRAFDLYERRYKYPSDRVSCRCIDFKNLEQKSKEYEISKNHTKDILDESATTKIDD